MMEYKEEEYLMLSGIQHYAFCKRQWALIHIEQQWQENVHTIEGELMHKNAHDRYLSEKRSGVIITRGIPIYSRAMGVSGNCDIVEFQKGEVQLINVNS
jgi:CRISPR-associated exonuclease Cas4